LFIFKEIDFPERCVLACKPEAGYVPSPNLEALGSKVLEGLLSNPAQHQFKASRLFKTDEVCGWHSARSDMVVERHLVRYVQGQRVCVVNALFVVGPKNDREKSVQEDVTSRGGL
jgi:hypothetical protein